MHGYEVGKLYHPGRTKWPAGNVYNYLKGQHELLIFADRPTTQEIAGVRKGQAEFALLIDSSIIFLLSRFGSQTKGFPWGDAPYCWWLNAPEMRTLPNPEPTSEERIFLHIMLIDAATGILQANRAVTLSPEFSAALHAAIREQAGTPIEAGEYNRKLDAVYRRYPTTESMLARATIRSLGGE